MISKDTLEAVKIGILTDEQLKEAISHYKQLETNFTKKRTYKHNINRDIIVKCTIPKGSKYIIAEDNSVISNKLIIEEIVKR